jgi:GTPase SAR1 family protein
MKVILVGIFKSGKTRTLNRLLGLETNKSYIPTNGAMVEQYKNAKGTTIDVWDIAGNEAYPGLRDGYFIGANICFVFGNELSWVRDLKRTVPDVTVYYYKTFSDFKQKLDHLGP